jgi:hypothetical protein
VENVSPILSPDKAPMLQHLELLFGRALSGRIEITGIHTDDQVRPRTRTRFFDVGELEAIADFAAEINAEPGRNVYVGAALRNDDVFPGNAADDGDFLKTYAVWADADDQVQLDAARATYRALEITPPFIVVTGRTPTTRAQMWWPLEAPIDNIDTLRGLLRGIASALKTDPKVCTGKQLMRLAGTVNWPKKEDRVLERTEIALPSNAAREFPLEHLERTFPPIARFAPGQAIQDVEIGHGGSLGLDEKVMDGREAYAFRLVRAHLREWIGTTGSEPTADELYKDVAPVYLAKADQVRPGRGPEFLKQKVIDALRAYHGGQIPGMASLEEAVQTWAEKGRGVDDPLGDDEFGDDDAEPKSRPFRASDLMGDPPPRQWIVDQWIVEGAVNSLYGDGGVGKTLLAQQLACAVSMGLPWLGMPTKPGTVLAVLCEDEKDELWRRHNDIKAAFGHSVGNPFKDVWLWPRVGEENTLVRWDRDGKATLGACYAEIVSMVEEAEPSVLILDTLADVFGGNEIDRPQVNYFVKTVLGGLIKARAAAGKPLTILLLGHPSVAGKASGSGYSGSTAWNNAVRSRMYLTKPEEGGSDERVLTRGKANYASSGDETAIRLFFADGVLHNQANVEDGDSILWASRKEVVEKVELAWRRGEPYSAQKSHRRFIFNALAADLTGGGFTPSIVRQAIHECLEDGKILLSRGNEKRGYKAAGHDR